MAFIPETYVLLVAGSPKGIEEGDLGRLALKARFVITADSGADFTRHAMIPVDYIIGDLDSISSDVLDYYQNQETEFITAESYKDETDLELALDFIDRHDKLSSLPLVVTNVL